MSGTLSLRKVTMNKIPKYSWSFSSLGLMKCPRQYEIVRAKKIIQSPPSAAGDEGSRIHKLIEDYFNEDKWDDELLKWKRLLQTYKAKGGVAEAEYAFKWGYREGTTFVKYTPDGEKELDPNNPLDNKFLEQAKELVRCEMDDPDVWFRGILDWLKLDFENGTAEVVDWKTGRVKPSTQMQLYAWVLFLAHPEINRVKCTFHWINHNDQLPAWFERKDMDKYFAPFQEILETIDNCYETDTWIEIPGEIQKSTKRGSNCRFCPVTPEHCSEGKY